MAFHYESEEEVHQVNGDVIDLMPIIHEIFLLEVPMQVFCEDSTEEGAPQSGKDWEVIHEQDKKEKIDPRLAGLRNFLIKMISLLIHNQKIYKKQSKTLTEQ